MTDQEIWEFSKDATRAPWSSKKEPGSEGVRIIIEDDTRFFDDITIANQVHRANASFIAASRTWVPQALHRFETIRQMHIPENPSSANSPNCVICQTPWPCQTRRLADGETL